MSMPYGHKFGRNRIAPWRGAPRVSRRAAPRSTVAAEVSKLAAAVGLIGLITLRPLAGFAVWVLGLAFVWERDRAFFVERK